MRNIWIWKPSTSGTIHGGNTTWWNTSSESIFDFFFFCKGLILPHDGVSLRIKQYIIILSYPRAIYNTFLWRNNLLSIGNSCPLCKVISLAENQSGNQKDKLSSTVSGWATTRTSKVKTGTEDNLRDANWCRIAMEYTLFVTVLKQIITTVRNK